jgi:hypothetical protein
VDDEHTAVIQFDHQVLGAASDPNDLFPDQSALERRRRGVTDDVRPEDLATGYFPTDKLRSQFPSDRFDFREFGHRSFLFKNVL